MASKYPVRSSNDNFSDRVSSKTDIISSCQSLKNNYAKFKVLKSFSLQQDS